MGDYTVVLIFPGKTCEGRDGTVVDFCYDCPTPAVAARRVKRDVVNGTDYDPDDCEIIAVFEGVHNDVYEPSLDTQEYEDQVEKEMQ